MSRTVVERLSTRAAIALLAALLQSTGAIAASTEYEVVYDVFRNDKQIGEATGRFVVDGAEWTVESVTVGKKGLARILGVRASDISRGQMENGRPLPLSFSHSVELRGPDQGWTAEFDRAAGVIRTTTKDGNFTLEYGPDVYDPGSLQLALRMALAEGTRDWPARVVDEDELDQHRYLADEYMEASTALGCRILLPVERIREGSSRYVFSWHDPEFEYLPLRVIKGKRGGDETELRISALTWSGREVAVGNPCAEE